MGKVLRAKTVVEIETYRPVIVPGAAKDGTWPRGRG